MDGSSAGESNEIARAASNSWARAGQLTQSFFISDIWTRQFYVIVAIGILFWSTKSIVFHQSQTAPPPGHFPGWLFSGRPYWRSMRLSETNSAKSKPRGSCYTWSAQLCRLCLALVDCSMNYRCDGPICYRFKLQTFCCYLYLFRC